MKKKLSALKYVLIILIGLMPLSAHATAIHYSISGEASVRDSLSVPFKKSSIWGEMIISDVAQSGSGYHTFEVPYLSLSAVGFSFQGASELGVYDGYGLARPEVRWHAFIDSDNRMLYSHNSTFQHEDGSPYGFDYSEYFQLAPIIKVPPLSLFIWEDSLIQGSPLFYIGEGQEMLVERSSAAPVSEPATVVLLFLGLLTMGTYLRKCTNY